MRIILIGMVLIFLFFTAPIWIPLVAIGGGVALIGAAVGTVAAVHEASSAPQPQTPPDRPVATIADAQPIPTKAETITDNEKQAATAAEAQRLSVEGAAVASAEQLRTAATEQQPPMLDQTPVGLPGVLNDTLRAMLQRTGKHCNAITDHVWVTPNHVSIMCDRRLRAAFVRESDSWRFGRPGE